jgi:hypothetical protein
VRTHSVVCLRCYRPLAVRAPAPASRDASRPGRLDLGSRDPGRQAGVGKGLGRHRSALREGSGKGTSCKGNDHADDPGAKQRLHDATAPD